MTADFAHAQASKLLTDPIGVLTDWSLIAIGKTLAFLLFILGFLGGMCVFLGGTLTNWALDLNSTVLQNPTVSTGWIITRDLANLGFVLAIILIAFATILRFENYAMKKTLMKLILAAVLINFSLVFAGVFLDFSGMLTDFFLNKATDYNPLQLGEKLAGSFQVQKLLEVKKDAGAIQSIVAGMANDINSTVSFIASLFFVVLFTGIAAITLISLATVLFIRYIFLTILLILMPLAWLLWIWPETEHLWKEWWSEFLKWAFFAPSASFFIYLALSIAVKEKGLAIDTAGELINPGNAFALTIENIGGIIGQMISIIGILLGGIIVSEKAAGKLAPEMMKAAMGFKDVVLGGAARTSSSTIGRAYEGIRGKSFSQDLRSATAGLSSIPVLGGLAAQANSALVEGTDKRMEEYKKKFKNMDDDALSGYLERDPLLMREEERAALMGTFAEKNKLSVAKKALGYDEKTKKFPSAAQEAKYLSFAQSTINQGGPAAKSLISRDPMLAKLKVKIENKTSAQIIQERKAEVLKALKMMTSEAIDDLDLEIFDSNPEYLAELKGMHLNRILERGVADQQKFLQYLSRHLIAASGLSTPPPYSSKLNGIKNLINTNPGWAYKIDNKTNTVT